MSSSDIYRPLWRPVIANIVIIETLRLFLFIYLFSLISKSDSYLRYVFSYNIIACFFVFFCFFFLFSFYFLCLSTFKLLRSLLFYCLRLKYMDTGLIIFNTSYLSEYLFFALMIQLKDIASANLQFVLKVGNFKEFYSMIHLRVIKFKLVCKNVTS